MVKVYDIGTFRMGARGGHFAIVVLSALGRLTMVVSSTIPAWDASVNNCGVVQDDRREPPRIEGHRPGPLGILSDQDSLLATTARCQWRAATGSPSNRPHSVHGPSKSRAAASELVVSPLGSEASGEPVQGCRTKAMVGFLSDAPAWPRFLPRHAHSKGGM